MKEIIDKLFTIMDNKNITAYQVSKATGIGQTTISSWKNGSKPAIDKFIKVIQYIGISADELFELKPITEKLEILEIKQEVTQNKIDNLTFRVATIEHNQNKEFKKLNDEVDTLIEVMEAKGVLPKVE